MSKELRCTCNKPNENAEAPTPSNARLNERLRAALQREPLQPEFTPEPDPAAERVARVAAKATAAALALVQPPDQDIFNSRVKTVTHTRKSGVGHE
jgi:hypothetical protein